MDAIKITNLVKTYGKSRGVNEISLTVKEGDYYGFMGPNGAGKSTTIRTLLGLIKANSGEAFIFDKDIRKTDSLLSVGYLPSEAIFYKEMKVIDIFKLSAKLHKLNDLGEALILADRLKLDINKKVEELSFGNRKKVGIVCALLHNPKLVILDEPTSGLDPLMQREFFNILREKNEAGTTIFMSSHILSEIQNNCKNACIIKEGKIILEGSVDDLLNTSTKRVKIKGSVDVNNLEGVMDLYSDSNEVSFLYNGDINKLINLLSNNNVADVTISEASLEEIFMHYYS